MGRIYDRAQWRSLTREGVCAVHVLTGASCEGALGYHHAHPLSLDGDPEGPIVLTCQRHHPMLEALSRRVHGAKERKRCPHPPGTHRYPGAKAECERRLNRELTAA